MNQIKVGSDFSGVGAFIQALNRINQPHLEVFACDMDKYARQMYLANYPPPLDFPENVYNRRIPNEPLDVYMTSPPCQDFSMSGQRPKESEKTVLFLNSHEFIKNNLPRFFVFENVKGLISHNKQNKGDEIGQTLNLWLQFLGGKSINGNANIFPHEMAVPYHIYWTVLNTKDFNVPQNRERVFIVGIRDDQDNVFSWPKVKTLSNRLMDLLEHNVPTKYYLSTKQLNGFIMHAFKSKKKGSGFSFKPSTGDTIAAAITTRAGSRGDDNFIAQNKNDVYLVKSATKNGFKVAQKGDSINYSVPNSKTRRGRVGHGVAQTLDTSYNQAIIQNGIRRLTPRECFRLQDFPDDFKFVVSDTQLYKQAGNSITVGVLAEILKKLNLNKS